MIPDQVQANREFFARSRLEWESLGGFPWPSGRKDWDEPSDPEIVRALEEAHEEWLQREFEADLRAAGHKW